MPYRRRPIRRTRRRSSRRPRRSTRRARMARPTAQRYFKHKLTMIDEIFISTGTLTETKGGYALQQPQEVGTNLVKGFDSASRWADVYRNYDQYAITGMKIRWIPGSVRGGVLSDGTGAAASWLGSMILYFDTDTYDTSTYTFNTIAQLDKQWIFDPTRSWSKYFSCKKLSQMQNVAWQDTREYNSGTPTFNGLTKASIGYWMQH